MSRECSIVRGVSFLLAVLGLASIAMAAVAFFFGPSVDLGIEDQELAVRALSVVLLVIGLLELVTGVLGVCLSKRPAHLKPFVFAASALAFVNLFEVALKVGSGDGGPVWVNLLYAAACFTAVVYASRAMKSAGAGTD